MPPNADYLQELETWCKDNPAFDVGMSVLVYERDTNAITGMGRIVDSQWVGCIEYDWVYLVQFPTGRQVWIPSMCLEVMVMYKQEIKAYMRVVK